MRLRCSADFTIATSAARRSRLAAARARLATVDVCPLRDVASFEFDIGVKRVVDTADILLRSVLRQLLVVTSMSGLCLARLVAKSLCLARLIATSRFGFSEGTTWHSSPQYSWPHSHGLHT